MTIKMNDDSLISVAQLKEFATLQNSANFKSNNPQEAYQWIEKTLGKFRYTSETKKNKGIIKRYISSLTGYSNSNVDKLIARKRRFGKIFIKERTQNTFETFYTNEDVVLLAKVVNAYRGQNGNAIRKVLGEMYTIYEDHRFERLSVFSNP
jgi:Zn-dependent M32 family carboxypeptidase